MRGSREWKNGKILSLPSSGSFSLSLSLSDFFSLLKLQYLAQLATTEAVKAPRSACGSVHIQTSLARIARAVSFA